MSKRTSQIIRAGQMKGAKLKIESVNNKGLQESVTIINQGTVAQPMSGWVLASLRGQAFYQLPDDLILEENKALLVQSGKNILKNKPDDGWNWIDLLWTADQIWNNHRDTAILFDPNGLEIDRFSYPHKRTSGRSADQRKNLVRNEDGFEIVNEVLHRPKKVTRKQIPGQFNR